MKDESATLWMGELPAEWNTTRISSLYVPRNEKVSADDYPALSVTMQGIVPQLETAAKTQDTDNRKLVKEGDFVINSRSDRRGSCGIAHQDGSVSLISNVLNPINSDVMDQAFFEYLFKTEGFADEYYKWGTGIVDDLWSTNWSRMKNIVVAFPSHEDQKRIAEYLDTRTSEIDLLIEQTEHSIKLLEEYRKSVISEAVTKGIDSSATMKDSGVEWIGNVPSSWNKSRISEACNRPIGYGIIKLGDYPEDKGVPVFRCSNVREGHLDLAGIREVKKELSDDYKRTILKGGEVLINVRGTLGGCALVPESCAGYNIAREVAMVDVKETISSRFIMYYLLSNGFWDYLNSNLAGSVYQGLNIELLGKACIFLPPTKKEQEDISDYLDENVGYLNQIIQLKREEVELLQECRKSIISEVVTGKFKVPEVG